MAEKLEPVTGVVEEKESAASNRKKQVVTSTGTTDNKGIIGETEYTKAELLKNAEKVLGVKSYVAAGALREVEKSTVSAAKEAVKKFIEKEVK